jgi:hypothetical protein
MKKLGYLILVLMVACQGKLSDEQRKQMKEQMELHKIKRVTEVEITEAAYARGRSIMVEIESCKNDSVKLDSVLKAHHGKVRWIIPDATHATMLEQQLINAYVAEHSGAPQDNVQKVHTTTGHSDSLLYTKPVIITMPDGSDRLEGAWNIWLSKKELILSIDK